MRASNRFTWALVLVSALALAACGGDSNGGGGGGPDGADTPQDLVDRLSEVAKREAMDEMVALVLPPHRGMLTYMIGVAGPSMMMGMMEAMGGMTELGGPEKAAEFKGKMDAMKKDWEGVMSKHDLKIPADENPMAAMMTMGGDGDMDKMVAKFDQLLGDVDHRAFLRDSLAFLSKHSDKDKQGGGPSEAFKKFDAANAKIEQTGDSATVTVKDDDRVLKLKKSDGRWYIDLLSMVGK